MGLGIPLIVSDIEENLYAVQDTALTFKKANIECLTDKISYAEKNHNELMKLAEKAKQRALQVFNWDRVTDEHIRVFTEKR
jgi:glycosyltransferase involved in cell wall biosynthesis